MCLWISSMTKPRLVKPIADTSRQMLDNDMNVTSAIVAQHSWCGCKNEVSFFQQTKQPIQVDTILCGCGYYVAASMTNQSQSQTNPRYLPANVRQWHEALAFNVIRLFHYIDITLTNWAKFKTKHDINHHWPIFTSKWLHCNMWHALSIW